MLQLPATQLLTESRQVAPFWHGEDTHSSVSISQS